MLYLIVVDTISLSVILILSSNAWKEEAIDSASWLESTVASKIVIEKLPQKMSLKEKKHNRGFTGFAL
jgi:hypothetical protein